MWVGTNAGQIFVYNITLPEEENKEEGLKAEMGKEIKLRHKAPVVAIFVVDKEGLPLLGDLADDDDKGEEILGCFCCLVNVLELVMCFFKQVFLGGKNSELLAGFEPRKK